LYKTLIYVSVPNT